MMAAFQVLTIGLGELALSIAGDRIRYYLDQLRLIAISPPNAFNEKNTRQADLIGSVGFSALPHLPKDTILVDRI